jgi:hypothetical protein
MKLSFFAHVLRKGKDKKCELAELDALVLPQPFVNKGFHGDEYLLELVDTIIPQVDTFIETGTQNGVTISHVAHTYPRLRCLSCEPDQRFFRQAYEHTKRLPNVSLYNEGSQQFISKLKKRREVFGQTLFWLDAHGYGFSWPLKEEIAFITNNFNSAFILIDDFKVPGMDCFGFDVYEDQECSFEYIKDSLNPERTYQLYYPSYTERTSDYHPLRGWVLIAFGQTAPLYLPLSLAGKIRQAPLTKDN